jgi:hypothetical protein
MLELDLFKYLVRYGQIQTNNITGEEINLFVGSFCVISERFRSHLPSACPLICLSSENNWIGIAVHTKSCRKI